MANNYSNGELTTKLYTQGRREPQQGPGKSRRAPLGKIKNFFFF